jgi:hypothetical protein
VDSDATAGSGARARDHDVRPLSFVREKPVLRGGRTMREQSVRAASKYRGHASAGDRQVGATNGVHPTMLAEQAPLGRTPSNGRGA